MDLNRMTGAWVAGLLFGSGLMLSGMTDPANVLRFLDLAGNWSPALAVVMASAIAVAAPVFGWVRARQRSLLDEPLNLDNRRPVDKPLLAGAAVFGVGWGLSGLCPGPALMLAVGQGHFAWIFVAAMVAGLWLGPLVVQGRREDG
ncbi:MAG TPA: DUF6691 family protein [Fluviicoccus sp.]|nr:DUF6691 family protein [Fluviicoccus sp.]